MIKKILKVLVMSLLMTCMLGNSVSAAESHVHTWVQTGNSNCNSWSYTHAANTDGGYCLVYCWVSSEYVQCSVCKRRKMKHLLNMGDILLAKMLIMT